MEFLIYVIQCCAFVAVFARVSTTQIVSTPSGDVSGIVKTYTIAKKDVPVYQYIGIPYAEPPLGDARFTKPKPIQPWTGIFNATEFGPSCMQNLYANDEWLLPNHKLSEDCLQLNVFIPRVINPASPKSVMIWIHGGSFTNGQGTLYDGSYLAVTGDVIVVTINYRVGLFGFLSTEDSNAVGNYGLWDQHLAIKWVNDNIGSFGGDTKSVCIFGESAGGYSVGLQAISPLNKGLFQRAIMESGTNFSPRSTATKSREVAKHAGRLLNCTASSTDMLVKCLKSKPAAELLRIQNEAINNGWENVAFSFENHLGPVIDGDIVVEDPLKLNENLNSSSFAMFSSIGVMAGCNNAEGGSLYFKLGTYQKQYNFNISVGVPSSVVCDLMASAVSRDYYYNQSEVADAICTFYTVPNGTLAEQGRSALNIYGDLQFMLPAYKTMVAHTYSSQAPSQYQYLFLHKPTYSWIQERPPWLRGANHAGEVPFVFGLHAMYKDAFDKPEWELSLSKDMMIYWSNFAKTGNPNKPTRPSKNWPSFTMYERGYVQLNTPHPRATDHMYDERVKFWMETIPAIVNGTSQPANLGNGTISHNKHTCSAVFIQFLVIYLAIKL